MDKRRLMKFIQLSMDYATKISISEELVVLQQQQARRRRKQQLATTMLSESEVQSLNERHLNQGRSLARPQNKAVATDELQILEQCIEDGNMTFDDFLSTKYKLSDKLRDIVRYALAWEVSKDSTSLARGMSTLRQHLQALGRYGTTAFLFPMYGSGELSQAFCRSAAVFGATYLLRRAPLAIQCSTLVDDDKDNTKTVEGVLLSGDTVDNDVTETNNKVIKCSQVVLPVNALPAEYLPPSLKVQRTVRRICILNGQIISSESGEQRHVVFIPPNTIDNSYAIHGVLLDNSVSVTPKGCTLLHLTTTSAEGEDPADVVSILEKAQHAIMESHSRDECPKELYHVSFSHECPVLSDNTEDDLRLLPKGVHVCGHTGQVLTADVAFEEAYKIFSTICPGVEFLGLSNTFDEAIRERAEEKRYGDDDEKMMLDSALGMIEQEPNNGNGDGNNDDAEHDESASTPTS